MSHHFKILILLISSCFVSKAQDIKDIRHIFHQAVLDPGESRTFHTFLEDATPSDATIKAYKAVSEAMLAQVVWNPFTKLSQVRKYDKLMEVAVEQDPDNVEIRFLRFAIEYNLPRFLGMSTHLDEDRDTIFSHLSSVNTLNLDRSFGRYILYFMDDTGLCDDDQIALMEERLAAE